MDKKLKKDILRALKEKDVRCNLGDIRKFLVEKYGYEKEFDGETDLLRARVGNYLRMMADEGLLVHSELKEYGGISGHYYNLSSKGYQEFDAWYKKAWRFFTDDLAKILSVVSILLSIVATIVSFMK